jgi:hypothetical protein
LQPAVKVAIDRHGVAGEGISIAFDCERCDATAWLSLADLPGASFEWSFTSEADDALGELRAAEDDQGFARELRAALAVEGMRIDGLVDHMSSRFELTAARRALMREASALLGDDEELDEWLPER